MTSDKVNSPHDRYFKQTLSHADQARDFVLHYLPAEITRLLDLDTLSVCKGSFVDRQLQHYFSDLLYHVEIKPGRSAFVYLLFEHKSSPDRLTAYQVLRYMVRIWAEWLKRGETGALPPVIPVVLYHGLSCWKIGLTFEDLFELPREMRPLVPKFEYLLCDLSQYSDEEIKGAIRLRLPLLLLKHIFSKDLTARLPDFLKLLRSLSDDETALEALEAALRYVASANDQVKAEDLIRNAKAVFHGKGGDIMPTLAEQWIEQGIQQGMQKGMQQGMQKGMERGRKQGLHQGIQEGTLKGTRTMVAEALKTKFDTLPEEIFEKIEEIDDVDVLTKLLREAINARDMEEFKTVLAQL